MRFFPKKTQGFLGFENYLVLVLLVWKLFLTASLQNTRDFWLHPPFRAGEKLTLRAKKTQKTENVGNNPKGLQKPEGFSPKKPKRQSYGSGNSIKEKQRRKCKYKHTHFGLFQKFLRHGADFTFQSAKKSQPTSL